MNKGRQNVILAGVIPTPFEKSWLRSNLNCNYDFEDVALALKMHLPPKTLKPGYGPANNYARRNKTQINCNLYCIWWCTQHWKVYTFTLSSTKTPKQSKRYVIQKNSRSQKCH